MLKTRKSKIIAGLIVGGALVLLFLYFVFFGSEDRNRLNLN